MFHHPEGPLQGLSLLEMLVTLTLAGIMSGLAMVYMPDWADRRRSDAIINNLRTAINTARHAAIAKNVNVVVCLGQARIDTRIAAPATPGTAAY